jgi:hypothetical protein
MDSSRRQQAEGCDTDARCQELGCYRLAGSGSNETTVCHNRWRDVLNPSINRASERKVKWTAVEDSKLNDAVQTHGGENWSAISALVPDRTRSQCFHRWREVLDPSINRANERKGKWTEDEDIKLKDAVQTH